MMVVVFVVANYAGIMDLSELTAKAAVESQQPQVQPESSTPPSCEQGPAQVGLFPLKVAQSIAPFLPNQRKTMPGVWMTNATENEAACYFSVGSAPYQHFPHGMQNLYRCWAFWKEQDLISSSLSTKPLQKTLYFPQPFPRSRMNRYWGGIVDDLIASINLTIVQPDPAELGPKNWTSELAKNGIGYTFVGGGAFSFLKEEHCTSLRQTLLPLHSSIQIKPCFHRRPQLIFLNRRSGARSIINGNDLYTALLDLNIANVSLVHFDDKSFEEQIKTYAESDILVSPHGAQMTGLFMMPKCGSFVEIFPAGFGVSYFQTLMRSCGLNRRYVHLGGGNMLNETQQNMRTREGRSRARDRPLCVNITMVVDAVKGSIEDWSRCCQDEGNDVNDVN